MRELVVFLEEPSAKALLQGLLPRVLDPSISARLIAFEGKQDLEKQLTRKLRSYTNPHARFMVLRDQDSAPDCREVKHRLVNLCDAAGKRAESVVRIACRELETIYLADLHAVEVALGLPGLAQRQQVRKFRRPDVLESPSRELVRITGGRYQKVSSSRQLALHLDLNNHRSPTFKQLLVGLKRIEGDLLALPAQAGI
jgi:hypothetical protein